jgi:hypothetical protein
VGPWSLHPVAALAGGLAVLLLAAASLVAVMLS